ncbi:hypothetical protein [Terrabacter sp. Soil810]|uniref:hypothetical protein n=1 Tax=Terrabacter sp. Soil810 TaxID=1736418 RepID=UPI00070C56D5|nr:hypothetical protein [Terrabacter sp. Soil810]KRF38401.1 hypothetical protein ASG96_18385 [Terrabacter sp. Soil810]
MRNVVATAIGAAAIIIILPVPVASASPRTVVEHNVVLTVPFPDDICGPRANLTTFTRKVEQSQFIPGSDGSFSYRDVAAVTYSVDFVDPSIPDVTGRLTEVNHYVLTPAGTFTGSTTYHDFFGDVRIFVRFTGVQVGDTIVVDRTVESVSGCP